MTLRILAIDGGKMTGLAYYSINEPHELSTACFQLEELPFEQAEDRIIDLCHHFADTPHNLHVVAERYVITTRSGKLSNTDTNWTIETNGIARAHARRGGHTFRLQGAGEAKKFCPDSFLKSVCSGMSWRTEGMHQADALRHLFMYLASAFPHLYRPYSPLNR